MNDVYKAPSASLDEKTVPYSGSGSLESGVAGTYDFSIGGVIAEAWARTVGSKWTIWLALICFFIVLVIVSTIFNLIARPLGLSATGESFSGDFIRSYFMQGLQSCVTIPMSAGVYMLGIKLVVRAPVDFSEIFRHFEKIGPLILLNILRFLMVSIGFCLLILPGIYLAVAYYLSVPLVVEKNLAPWEAMEASRKAVSHHWFKIFFLYLAVGVIVLLSMLLLGLGLIWTVPMSMLVSGVVYRTVFGFSGEVYATPDPFAEATT